MAMEDKVMKTQWMKWFLIALLAVGTTLTVVSSANASVRFRGGIIVGPAYGPWGWYHPYFYGPSYYGPYGAYPNAGEVKLETKVKDAEVFINGAYAGVNVASARQVRLGNPRTWRCAICRTYLCSGWQNIACAPRFPC